MPYIDFHTHFDSNKFTKIYDAYSFLSKEAKKYKFNKIITLQLLSQPWSREEVGELNSEFNNIYTFVDIHPFEKDSIKKLKKYVTKYNYFGLKLHPRLNNFQINNKNTFKLVQAAGEMKIPVLIDCFPDGNSIIDNFKTADYGILCRNCKNTKIIAAHMGGIYCLEMLMIAKRCENLYLNIAYTFLYYRNSSITKNIIYAVDSLKGKKIFYGSDYPDRKLKQSLDLTKNEFRGSGISKKYLDNLFYNNAKNFLSEYEK